MKLYAVDLTEQALLGEQFVAVGGMIEPDGMRSGAGNATPLGDCPTPGTTRTSEAIILARNSVSQFTVDAREQCLKRFAEPQFGLF